MIIGNVSDRRQREQLRRCFRPDHVRLLFIGEAPPASGRFFYKGDSGLYRAIRDTFRIVDPSIVDAEFLTAFRASGSYLVDLCPDPVDRWSPKLRRAACMGGEKHLARAIRRLYPSVIVTLLRSIEGNVARAASMADWYGPVIHLPYPGRWSHHRKAFVDTLSEKLRAMMDQGALDPFSQIRRANREFRKATRMAMS